MFDFEEANKILEQQEPKELVVPVNKFETIKIQLDELDRLSEKLLIEGVQTEESACWAASMALQAKKLYQALDKERKEIIKPHFDFQKSMSEYSKSFESELKEIEESLLATLSDWMNLDGQDSIQVTNGTVSKKLKLSFDLFDIKEVPEEFLMLDEKKIQAALKAGLREIPGLKLVETYETTLKVKN